MKLSIVATLYRSAPHIPDFYTRASAAARNTVGEDYEIVLVNDGSPDDSLAVAISLAERDPHIVIVDLSRNFGHHKAMMTGLAHARGEQIFLIDSDLEEDPEYLHIFYKYMEKECCDVVYGVQENRKGGWFERWSGEWFYRLFNAITGLEMPKNPVTARLMTRRYVDGLLLHKEREIFINGLCHITGFNQCAYIIKKHSSSVSTYTLRKKVDLFVNSVTSFSNAPLIFIFYAGIFIFSMSLAYAAYLIIHWIFFDRPLIGWTSVIVSVWMIGGMIISFIGVIGIYLSKIFSETKRRPYTIVRKIYTSQVKMD